MPTVTDYVKKQKRKLENLKTFTVPFLVAVKTTVAEQGTRIFVKGKDSSGGTIGQYNDSTSLYVDPNTAPGQASKLKPPTGKTGKTIFASTGKPHKTTYVKSYKGLRQTLGFNVSFVDLQYTGTLRNDFFNSKTEGVATPTKISDTEYQVKLKNKTNPAKVEGLQDKYGKIFDLTKTERKRFFEFLDKEFQLALIK